MLIYIKILFHIINYDEFVSFLIICQSLPVVNYKYINYERCKKKQFLFIWIHPAGYIIQNVPHIKGKTTQGP